MCESNEWKDAKYLEIMEDELCVLSRRKIHDSSCTISDLEGTLSNLYIHEGNNWEGRGPLQDVVLSATIAAYEQFIHEWKKEMQSLL